MRWLKRITAAVSPNMFGGVTLGLWIRVLRDNGFAVDPAYWPRAAVITLMSLGYSVLGGCERLFYGRKIRETTVASPLFVLGVWRSGTTLLFNLLTQDRRFAFPNTYEAAFPHSFLLTEGIGAGLLRPFIPKKRPQDNVAFGVGVPQEDEFAMCSLVPRSMLMSLAFPRRAALYDRFLTLRDVAESQRREWQHALLHFAKKLTFKYGRPLVLKSPGHTGRLRLLLELFPDAKFVHIQRDPFAVFLSARHAVRKVFPWTAMQANDFADLDENTLRQCKELYEAYFDERHLIPAGRLCEIRFEDLERDPLGQMRQIYERLNLPDFQEVEPELRAHVDSLKSYEKNRFDELTASERERVTHEWRRCFDAWGCPTEPAKTTMSS
jgi:omega-hydroxy-beta-dihydromenaquinone-9 sulfotransferase